MTHTATPFTSSFDQLNERFSEYNEKALDAGRKVSHVYVDSFEKTATSLADFEERVGSASRNEVVAGIASAYADFTRDVARASSAAARELLRFPSRSETS